MKYSVYYVSDRTAITAEAIGKTLLSQFDAIHFVETTHRFIDNSEKAQQLADEITARAQLENNLPIVFSTLIKGNLRDILNGASCHYLDLFNFMMPELERVLKISPTLSLGLAHGSAEDANYEQRMDAVNFALGHDDGVGIDHYDRADIILAGVSRTGKTPTCVYLAMHYGIYAANYPLTEEELESEKVPDQLTKHRSHVFALTILPERLQKIRSSRMPDSKYSSLQQCQSEIRHAEAIFRHLKIPVFDVTTSSVEEIATTVLSLYGNS